MDFHSKEKCSEENGYVQRHKFRDNTISRLYPGHAGHTLNTSSQVPPVYNDWSFSAVDQNSPLTKPDSHDNHRHLLCNIRKVHSLSNDYSSQWHSQELPAHASKKRRTDVTDMETSPRKRSRGPESPDIAHIYGLYNDNRESRSSCGNEGSWNHEHDGVLCGRAQLMVPAGMNKSSPRKSSNEVSQTQNQKTLQLGSPLWQNSSKFNTFNCESLGHRVQERTVQDPDSRYATARFENVPLRPSTSRRATDRAIQPYQDSKVGYDSFASKTNNIVHTSQSGITFDVMETSRRILTQISKDSMVRDGSVAPQTPIDRTSSTQKVVAPEYNVRNSSHTEFAPRLQQAQPTSPKSDGAAEYSDESDSTPLEHILERIRYDQPRSHVDFSRSPYRAANILPRNSISYNDRSESETEIPQTHHKKSSGGGSTSPVYVDSPPAIPINTLTKKSIPMKDRLSLSRVEPNAKTKIDTLHDKQRRAAEMIIKKEREVLDREIFGVVVDENSEQNDREAKLAHIETQQVRDSKEKAQLFKEELQMALEREIKRLREEAVEKERRRREQEEERKRARRAVERKRQMAVEEDLKEERRRMAQEKIEASRLKEIADSERREQERQRAISVQAETAKRTEMELKREIARLQAASLKPATAFPSQPKKPTNTTLNAAEDPESLFIPETNERDRDQDLNNDPPSNYGADERSGAKSVQPNSIAEVFARSTNFRSRFQEDREAFDARRRAEAEKKRLENLKAKLAARYKNVADNSATYPSVTVREVSEDISRKDRQSRTSNEKSSGTTKGNRRSLGEHSLSPVINTELNGSTNQQQNYKAATHITSPAHPGRSYPSKVTVISDAQRNVPKHHQRRKPRRSEREKEARRKKDDMNARDKYLKRITQEAEEGGYTISEDEMNKRLDAYMKKREANYQKKKARQGADQDPPARNVVKDPDIGPGPATDIHTQSPIQTPGLCNQDAPHKSSPTADPEQRERDQSEMYMREAIEALAKSSNRGSRFASTAAKRTVLALQSDSEGLDESDESEEDPDDDLKPESLVGAKMGQYKDKCVRSSDGEEPEDKINGETQIQEQVETATACSTNSKCSPASTQLEGPSSTQLDPHPRNTADPMPQNVTNKELSNGDNKLVRVYTVNISQIVDGEEQPPGDINKFLNLSDANAFAADKIKEYQSADDTSNSHDYIDRLFHGQVAQDDANSTRIWVACGIEPSSTIPNFDPELLTPRFPTKSWFIRFETLKDIFNEDTQAWITHKTANILPNHHYSDVELANYAACEYLIQFLKPSRPVLDHLEQYENAFIPELRHARDDLCSQREPFQCGLEKSESQAQWLAEKEVTIEVVSYQMQGPLN